MSVSSENRGLQTWTDLSALPCHIVHDFNLLKDDVTMTPPPSVCLLISSNLFLCSMASPEVLPKSISGQPFSQHFLPQTHPPFLHNLSLETCSPSTTFHHPSLLSFLYFSPQVGRGGNDEISKIIQKINLRQDQTFKLSKSQSLLGYDTFLQSHVVCYIEIFDVCHLGAVSSSAQTSQW